MYFDNNEKLDLTKYLYNSRTVNAISQIAQDDELGRMIFEASKKIYDNYTVNGELCIFINPGMKSGRGRGNMGAEVPRSTMIHTRTGSHEIVWCDSAKPKPMGGFDFLPRNFKYDKKMISLDPTRDMEEIIFHMVFSARRNQTYRDQEEKRQYPALYLQDRVQEAKDHLSIVSKNSGVIFYLTNEASPIVKDKKVVDLLCSAWGVAKPENKKLEVCKSELITAVESAEALGDEEFGFNGFSKAVMGVIQQNAERLSTWAIIQRAMDRGQLKYFPNDFAWWLMGDDRVTKLKSITKVPVGEATRNKKFLVDFLMSHPEEVELLAIGVETTPAVVKPQAKVYLPDPVTEAYLTEELAWPSHRTLYRLISGEPDQKLSKKDMTAILVKYFVTDKKTLPDELVTHDPKDK